MTGAERTGPSSRADFSYPTNDLNRAHTGKRGQYCCFASPLFQKHLSGKKNLDASRQPQPVPMRTPGLTNPGAICGILHKKFWLCPAADITMQLSCVPREENRKVDELSQMVDKDNRQLNPKWLRACDQLWGPHIVDRFASELNATCPRFYSRFHCPGCEGIDTFGSHWGRKGDNKWMNPPFGMIGRVLKKLHADRA